MVAIGYEMYMAMLEKAVSNAKENNKNIDDNLKLKDVKIDIPISAYIPDKYIKDLVQKITMYHKISEIASNEDSLNVIEELIDRFGSMPKEVENLIKIVEIRNLCRTIGITKVLVKENMLILSSDKLKQDLKYNINTKDILMFVEFNIKNLQKMIS